MKLHCKTVKMGPYECALGTLVEQIKRQLARLYGLEPAGLKFFKGKTEIFQDDTKALFEYSVANNNVVRVETS